MKVTVAPISTLDEIRVGWVLFPSVGKPLASVIYLSVLCKEMVLLCNTLRHRDWEIWHRLS